MRPYWPQPTPRWPLKFPQINLLVEIAVDERRPEDVLSWYDRRHEGSGIWGAVNESLVADAVAEVYPERAVAIWQSLVEVQITQTSPTAYEVAAGFLRKLRRVQVQHGLADSWRRYVTNLWDSNKRKRRLVELLDQLLAEQ